LKKEKEQLKQEKKRLKEEKAKMKEEKAWMKEEKARKKQQEKSKGAKAKKPIPPAKLKGSSRGSNVKVKQTQVAKAKVTQTLLRTILQ